MTPTFPPDIVVRVKDETDIVEVVRNYVTLRAAGSSFKGLCPFHREKTPSFHVNPARQIYKCFGCGEGGDVISFLMAVEQITFPEALETLARSLDLDLSRFLREDENDGERRAFLRAHEVASRLWANALWDEREGRRGRDYLDARGIQPEILQRFEVGFAPAGTTWLLAGLKKEGVSEELALRSGLLRQKDGAAPFAYFRNRIIFPISNISKQVTGFGGRIIDQGEPKYLNSADSAYFSKGKLLYGFAAARLPIAKQKTAVLVEGYLDLLALAQIGVSNVAATCGTAFTPDQARLLRRGAQRLVVLFDGDRAGLQAAVRSCHVAMSAGLDPEVARPPAGEDPASLLQRDGAESLHKVLATAIRYLPFLQAVVEERDAGREGQERALRQALTSIAEVTDPLRKEYLLQEAAELFEIPLNALREHLASQASRRRPRRAEPVAPAAEQSAETMSGASGGSPEQARGSAGVPTIRTFTAVDVDAVEQELFAHILRDATGVAARIFLDQRQGLPLSRPESERLAGEIEAWRATTAGDPELSPATFVQERWHDTGAEGYRNYVSDLLVKEGVPEQTDFETAISQSLQRLRQGQRWRQD